MSSELAESFCKAPIFIPSILIYPVKTIPSVPDNVGKEVY